METDSAPAHAGAGAALADADALQLGASGRHDAFVPRSCETQRGALPGEAAVAAAVILEQYGYPPLLLDIESVDLLDHVLFVFQKNGLWGSIARSRDTGLHGRKPVFRNLRQLVWSYFDPYIDRTGRIKGYGLTSLYDLDNYDWRCAGKNMHKIEDHLRAIPHHVLRSSDRRYEFWHERYLKFKKRFPDKSPVYYDNRNQWML